MNGKKRYFLSETEFSICCAAAGINGLPCFEGTAGVPPDEAAVETAVWQMVQRGLMKAGEDGFTLCRELSSSFQTMEASQVVLTLRRELHSLSQPYCLAYGANEQLVSLQPGNRKEDYVGIALYEGNEVEEWLEDVRFSLDGNMPDDLLETAEDAGETEGFPSEVEKFLRENTWPSPGAPEPPQIPQEIAGCVDCRDKETMRLLRRCYLVRLSLFDRIVSGSEEGVVSRIYRPGAVAGEIRQMLWGKALEEKGSI